MTITITYRGGRQRVIEHAIRVHGYGELLCVDWADGWLCVMFADASCEIAQATA